MYISINREEMPELSHRGAEGSEKFEGFRLVSLSEAKGYLRTGRDGAWCLLAAVYLGGAHVFCGGRGCVWIKAPSAAERDARELCAGI